MKALFFFSSPFRHLACILFFLTLVVSSNAQKQLVFIRHGKVVSRFTIGSPIRLKLKNHQYKEGRIVELNDFSMVTSNDTIKFQSIAKLHSKHIHQVRVNSGIGGLLFVGGLGYIAIDQLNASLGYNKSGWDQTDQKALVAAGVGAALLFIRPRYTRLPPGTAIRVVDYTSLFYLIP